MERRVIKFNLMGAIFTVILIICAIVGVIIGINKLTGNKDKNNTTQMANNTQVGTEEIDVNKTYEEYIIVDGQKQAITMKYFKSEFDYIMKYDIDSFYVDVSKNDVDEFKSKYTDMIYINISKRDDNYSEKVKEINEESVGKKQQNSSYTTEQVKINDKFAIKVQQDKVNGVSINYIIEAKEGYFEIDVYCGKELKQAMIPTIEKMIESFKEI